MGISETGRQSGSSDHRDFAVSKNATKKGENATQKPYFVACNWAMMVTGQGQNRICSTDHRASLDALVNIVSIVNLVNTETNTNTGQGHNRPQDSKSQILKFKV